MIPALLNSGVMFLIVYSVGRVLKLPLILTLIIQIIIGVAVYLLQYSLKWQHLRMFLKY